jgi:membrane protease YdiL (CAAX protease family)
MRNLSREKIRSIALTIASPLLGFVLIAAVEIALKTEVSKLTASVVNLIVVSCFAFLLFPRYLGIPFGKIEVGEYLRRLGFYYPKRGWRHVFLGVVLAACTLSGMLAASMLTGKYEIDASTINLPHLVFSLNPGIWEELFYRGVMMILLLKYTGSVKKAALIQLVLFGLLHIKGLDAWAFLDVVSVMVIAVGFTYAAYKTQTLIAGIVFHYLHDALLFFVQVPDEIVTSTAENLYFFGLLWLMVAVGCGITKVAAERFGVRSDDDFYVLKN